MTVYIGFHFNYALGSRGCPTYQQWVYHQQTNHQVKCPASEFNHNQICWLLLFNFLFNQVILSITVYMYFHDTVLVCCGEAMITETI